MKLLKNRTSNRCKYFHGLSHNSIDSPLWSWPLCVDVWLEVSKLTNVESQLLRNKGQVIPYSGVFFSFECLLTYAYITYVYIIQQTNLGQEAVPLPASLIPLFWRTTQPYNALFMFFRISFVAQMLTGVPQSIFE